jgi:hypothetical protein
MSVTTIKVDSVLRDRLAHLARARGTTMGALLDDLARRAEIEQRWADIASAYRRAQADPDGWRDYLDELAEWDASGAERDAAAAEEWPEYNR